MASPPGRPVVGGPVVTTTLGQVRGSSTADGIHVFKGVRYGAPAGGGNRFRPPAPATPWTGIADATEYGPACPQIGLQSPEAIAKLVSGTSMGASGTSPVDLVGGTGAVDEDCLFLNVRTPGLGDGARRPVMVWLHGGAFSNGSGARPVCDGTALARRGDVVAITLNHRLGLLGYLHLGDILGEEYASSGHAGMLDIVMALEWIRDNVEAFGGDPGNVMIYGVSGGGGKVSALLSMPGAAGLFHRAAVQSGAALRFPSREQASERAAQVLAELALPDPVATAITRVPVAKLLDIHVAFIERAGGMAAEGFGFSPHFGDDVLPVAPADAIAAGDYSGSVPLLIGTTREEYTRFLAPTGPLDDDQVRARLGAGLGARADDLVRAYRASAPAAPGEDLLVWLLSDQKMRMEAIEMAERKARGGSAGVYLYLLTWPSPALGGWARATHSLCTPLVMDNCDASPMTAPYEQSREVAAAMSDAWIAFARSGDPSHPGLPPWPRYDPEHRSTMLFDLPSHVEQDPYGDRRRAWASLNERS